MLNSKTNNYFILFVCLLAIKAVHLRQYPDYTNHPCVRPCNKETPSMTCQYEWKLTRYRTMGKECECELPDNCRRPKWNAPSCIPANGIGRSVLTINHRLPGPYIQVCKNDKIRVRLENDLDSMETSIHWHGILQRGTPYMDGISRITQCAINTGSAFTYEFSANDTGTHLYHSHSGIQRADGLFGAIIVRDEEDMHSTLYDFDLPEHVIVFNDWFESGMAQEKIDAFKFERKNMAEPEAILINGRGSFKGATTAHMAIPTNVFKVRKNKRYRFRFISAGVVACPLQISIQNHTFSVIASDGQALKPENDVEALTIFAGERYDIVLNANQEVNNYWFRVKGLGNCNYLNVSERAVLNYDGQDLPSPLAKDELDYKNLKVQGKHVNNVEEPDIENNKNIEDLQGNMPKSFYERIRRKPDKSFYFELEFTNHRNPDTDTDPKNTDPNKFIFSPQINNISMEMPKVPLLTNWNSIDKNLVCNHRNREKVCAEHIKKRLVCRCIHIVEIRLNDLVEFVIVDATRFPLPVNLTPKHPMHLHGHKFAITAMYDLREESGIRSSMDTVNHMNRSGMIKQNLDSPPVKDTVALPHGGFAILRFVAKNPGMWLFHCHIDFHSELGMTLVFKVGNTSQFPLPPPNFPKCGQMEDQDSPTTIEVAPKLKNEAPKINFQDGVYKGKLIDGKMEGNGTFTWKNGDKYVGEFKNNLIEGHGVKYYSNGDKYEGQWKNDKRNGKGTITWKNGDVYTGDWEDDFKSGKGVFRFSNGDKYEGRFKNNAFDGDGILYYSNGDKIDGQWKNNMRYGKGVYTRKNGEKYTT